LKKVPISHAKTHLSRLVERACAGEDVVITNGRRLVVRLVPVDAPRPERRFGALAGEVWVDDALFDPMPDDLLDAWGDR